MISKLRITLAAISIALAAGCMKAGDGMGLDTTGNTVAFCTAHPDDASCKPPDPCANPTSRACSLSLCEKDPTRPGCQVVDCSKTPSAPGCSVNVCVANPGLPECQPKTTFAAVFTIMENNSCLTCHAPGGLGVTQGKLNLASADSAFANLVNVPASVKTVAPGWVRVNPLKADSSILIVKLSAATTTAKLPNGTGYGARMPMGFAALSPEDIATIRKWIQDGAVK